MSFTHAIYFYSLDNDKYWISYDDQESVELKAQYANLLNIAGCFGWSVNDDDFEGRYSDEPYPLLRVCIWITLVHNDMLNDSAELNIYPQIVYSSL